MPADVEQGEGAGAGDATTAPPPGMPGWVRVFLIVGLALVLLVVVAKVTGMGGDHGPGRHGGGGSDSPSSVVDGDGGHRSPVDHGK